MVPKIVQFWRGIVNRKLTSKNEKGKELMALLDMDKLPQHIAIIMDGNGRWATKRGLPRALGHRAGVESLREIVRLCSQLKIGFLTVYAFSTENWRRPKEEVSILMNLLVEYLHNEIAELHKQNVRINTIGNISELPQITQDALADAVQLTKDNTGLTLNLALNYGGRDEITQAVMKISEKICHGELNLADINEDLVAENLYTAGQPEPDLLIRPAGELRLSNFLLWQTAYTEFWMTPVLWPDFRREHIISALVDYQNRQRRFGGLKK